MLQEKDCFHVWNTWTEMGNYQEAAYSLSVEADGAFVKNDKNIKIFDGISSLFNCNIGYGNRKVIEAIKEQLEKMSAGTLFRVTNEASMELAIKLCSLTKNHFGHVFFTNSGSESTDTAFKIVRQYFWNKNQNKYKIISFKGAYHGNTLGAISACSIKDDTEPFHPLLPGFIHCDVYESRYADNAGYADLSVIDFYIGIFEKCIKDNNADTIAAVIFEPVQLSNDVNVLPHEYIKGICEICRKNNILIITDEVATGFGRTGKMFAMDHIGFYPDIMLLAKGLTSGYIPLGAVLVTTEIFSAFLQTEEQPKRLLFRNGFTTSGNPAACRAAVANIDVILEDNLSHNALRVGEYLLERLKGFKDKYSFVERVQGIGLFLSIIFDINMLKKCGSDKFSYVFRDIAFKKGIIVYPNNDVGESVLLAPVLTIDTEQADLIVKLLDHTLKICRIYLDQLEIEEREEIV